MLDNTEEIIKNGQSRKTGNIGYTRQKQKQKHNTICGGHHYTKQNKKLEVIKYVLT